MVAVSTELTCWSRRGQTQTAEDGHSKLAFRVDHWEDGIKAREARQAKAKACVCWQFPWPNVFMSVLDPLE